MKSTPIKRRRFLRYLLLVFVFYRCKKDSLNKLKPNTKSIVNQPPANVTEEYLGQYTITEQGIKLKSVQPIYMTSTNGYTDKASYLPGENITLHMSGPADDNATISLRDIRHNTILSLFAPIKTQTIKSTKPWAEGFKYDKTLKTKLPESLKSGVYIWPGDIPFICKGTSSSYDMTVVYPSNTINAYNYAGGKSLYEPDFDNRATVLSYLRSVTAQNVEFFQWLHMQNYNINYIADSDLDDYGSIENSKMVVITGHSEYWSRQSRLNIDKFVDSGKNVILLSGNNMWWQVRYNANKNLMICYKNNVRSSADIGTTSDPLGGNIYSTVNWGTNDVDYSISNSLGAEYRYGGYGNTLTNRWNGYKIVNAESPLLKGTGLKNGDILNMPTREYDGVPVVTVFGQGSSQTPVIDNSKLNFHKTELLGFDFAQNLLRRDHMGFGTFVVLQKTPTSGTIVNTATTNWCPNILVADGKIKTITKNIFNLSLNGQSLFST